MKTLKTISCSVTGYRKQLEGKPCEDATRVIHTKNATVVAVADGHGDPRCLFAHIGSQLAVRAACDVLKKYSKRIGKEAPSVFWNSRRSEIAQSVVQNFSRLAVLDYACRCVDSISADDKKILINHINREFSKEKEICTPEQIRQQYALKKRISDRLQSILYLYGTTLRASLITDRYMFHMAIGDGDTMILVDDSVEWVLPKSEAYECETASLCESAENVIDNFLFSYIEIYEEKSREYKLDRTGVCPQMIVLSTDGFRNSFFHEKFFAEKLKDMYVFEQRSDANCVRQIKKLFEKLTRESIFQDDISAVLCI